jgi:hypothetical protein
LARLHRHMAAQRSDAVPEADRVPVRGSTQGHLDLRSRRRGR